MREPSFIMLFFFLKDNCLLQGEKKEAELQGNLFLLQN